VSETRQVIEIDNPRQCPFNKMSNKTKVVQSTQAKPCSFTLKSQRRVMQQTYNAACSTSITRNLEETPTMYGLILKAVSHLTKKVEFLIACKCVSERNTKHTPHTCKTYPLTNNHLNLKLCKFPTLAASVTSPRGYMIHPNVDNLYHPHCFRT